MFRKKVTLFGRSIPLTAILLALFAISVAAWAGMALLNSVSITTADAPELAVPGNWTCFNAGSYGNSYTHAAFPYTGGKLAGGGLNLTVADLNEDDLGVRCFANVQNPDPDTAIKIVGAGTIPTGLNVRLVDNTYATCAPCTIAAGGSKEVGWEVISNGLGPGDTINFDIEMVPSY